MTTRDIAISSSLDPRYSELLSKMAGPPELDMSAKHFRRCAFLKNILFAIALFATFLGSILRSTGSEAAPSKLHNARHSVH